MNDPSHVSMEMKIVSSFIQSDRVSASLEARFLKLLAPCRQF